ncbi:tetratricopeptide repeat-containing diguanylate cyclase [Kangiella koreensis]|uniref:diguanylate cyclase n=1 Tax=Kangiella koreensis (strain DSM 16069 / JCM 12317 / KCTC 12182 / SW-125) TaxID=523791 RepID=C7R6M6_KANKD|nr:GGDEF domain-containing protein [Kangiella koreensis]ACV25542.1 diguanylate cyclase [Kangiella koreensis DSM 16069]
MKKASAMARRYGNVRVAVSIVDSERKPMPQTRRPITLKYLISPLFVGALIYWLSLSAYAMNSVPGIKGTFDDQHDNESVVGVQPKELTAEQKVFDELLYKIDSGQIELVTQQDFDKQLEKLEQLIPDGDEDRRLTYVYYQCLLSSIYDPQRGTQIANDMISSAKGRDERLEEGILYLCLANYEDRTGNTPEALLNIEKAIDIGKEVNDKILMADGYVSRCGIRSLLGENDFALKDCIQAEELYREEGVLEASDGLIFDIGIIFRRLGFLERAEKYFNRSEEVAKKDNLGFGLIRVYLQQGFMEEQRNNPGKAIEKYLAALKVAEGKGIITEMVPIRIALAGGYNLDGQYGKAMQELKLAEEARQKMGNSGYDGMASMYYGVAFSNLEQPEQAEEFFVNAEQLMLANNNKRYLALLYEGWAKSYERVGNSAKALEKYEKYMALQKELDRQRSDQQTQVLRFEYDSEKTEIENERLQQEQKLKDEQLESLQAARKWQILAIILGSVLTVVLIWFSLRQVANSRKFRLLAHTDSLTGLANRRQIERALKREMESSNQSGKPLSILMYDIDHFKVVNDIHGHSVGDVVLTNLSNFSKELLRDNDVLGRTGGEEFLAVLPNANLDQAIQVAKRLQQEVDLKQYTEIESELNATISVGVTEYKQGEHMDEFLRRVDEALYQAKENGRNRVEYVI